MDDAVFQLFLSYSRIQTAKKQRLNSEKTAIKQRNLQIFCKKRD